VALHPGLSSAIFDPLRPLLDALPQDRWPTHDELNALAAGVRTARGQPVRFVPARKPGQDERRHYETRVAQTGEVETRLENWHDLFNALVWITFPRAKAMLNEQHVRILEERGEAEARRRGPERDALTLFDEGGVVIATSAPHLMQLVRDFEWKELFWHRREELMRTTRFLVFGHACYEQLLTPYIGMVAKTVFVSAGAGNVDDALAEYFSDRKNFPSPKSLPPMPLLGVPGWHPRTPDETFYDDASYFRSRPRHA
jgi:hypothetical protein